MGQTVGSELFSEFGEYNPVLGQYEGDFVVNLDAIEGLLIEVGPEGQDLFSFWRNVIDLLDITVGIGNLLSPDWSALDDLISNSMPSDSIGLEAFMNPIYGNRKDVWPSDQNITGDDNDNLMYANVGLTNATAVNLYGSNGNDVLVKGSGSFYGTGSTGDDTYVISAGMGNAYLDYINENVNEGLDTIWYTGGLTLSDIRTWTDYTGRLYIDIVGNPNDQIAINGAWGSSGTDIHQKIERIVFDNGSGLNFADGLELFIPDGKPPREALILRSYCGIVA